MFGSTLLLFLSLLRHLEGAVQEQAARVELSGGNVAPLAEDLAWCSGQLSVGSSTPPNGTLQQTDTLFLGLGTSGFQGVQLLNVSVRVGEPNHECLAVAALVAPTGQRHLLANGTLASQADGLITIPLRSPPPLREGGWLLALRLQGAQLVGGRASSAIARDDGGLRLTGPLCASGPSDAAAPCDAWVEVRYEPDCREAAVAHLRHDVLRLRPVTREGMQSTVEQLLPALRGAYGLAARDDLLLERMYHRPEARREGSAVIRLTLRSAAPLTLPSAAALRRLAQRQGLTALSRDSLTPAQTALLACGVFAALGAMGAVRLARSRPQGQGGSGLKRAVTLAGNRGSYRKGLAL